MADAVADAEPRRPRARRALDRRHAPCSSGLSVRAERLGSEPRCARRPRARNRRQAREGAPASATSRRSAAASRARLVGLRCRKLSRNGLGHVRQRVRRTPARRRASAIIAWSPSPLASNTCAAQPPGLGEVQVGRLDLSNCGTSSCIAARAPRRCRRRGSAQCAAQDARLHRDAGELSAIAICRHLVAALHAGRRGSSASARRAARACARAGRRGPSSARRACRASAATGVAERALDARAATRRAAAPDGRSAGRSSSSAWRARANWPRSTQQLRLVVATRPRSRPSGRSRAKQRQRGSRPLQRVAVAADRAAVEAA